MNIKKWLLDSLNALSKSINREIIVKGAQHIWKNTASSNIYATIFNENNQMQNREWKYLRNADIMLKNVIPIKIWVVYYR